MRDKDLNSISSWAFLWKITFNTPAPVPDEEKKLS